ncbi:hypothetical protein RHMOL_Rhmol13G0231600 [Rhododendron molle]|uniref:Uncharacterized protein n=1 Tax=Rhododendron molle TaxID=49168 RepID=A0ACC0LB28_RHOML|nr:hypothetical protein RHMOL_Rhmol13G0231600 [Rhododendron molle]
MVFGRRGFSSAATPTATTSCIFVVKEGCNTSVYNITRMNSQADSCSSRNQPLPVAEGRKKRLKRSRNATPSSPWTQESINLAEDDVSLDTYAPLERPIGSKAEKGRLKKVKSHGCASSQIRELLNEMLEERKRVFKMQVKNV